MSKKIVLVVFLALLIALIGVSVASATGPCTCKSPGYWKNHLDEWPEWADPGDPYVNPLDPDASKINDLEEALQGGKLYRVSRPFVAAYLNCPPPLP